MGFERLEMQAAARAVRPPILIAAPPAPGLEVRGERRAEFQQQLVEPALLLAGYFAL